MKLYVQHPPHEPFPMAMVNREPWGGKCKTSGLQIQKHM